jgi:DNA-binding protein HU-beta
MTKEEFIKRVSKQTRLPQAHVSDILNASHRLLEDIMRAGEKITFPGFGTFYTSKRQGGKVKHVRTGKVIEYAARNVAAFRPGEYLKRAAAGKRRRGKEPRARSRKEA